MTSRFYLALACLLMKTIGKWARTLSTNHDQPMIRLIMGMFPHLCLFNRNLSDRLYVFKLLQALTLIKVPLQTLF